MMYDLAIVGAGPGGLMAAREAAAAGLSVAVLERRTDISTVTRACCQQLIMDRDFQGESLRFDSGVLHFTKNGFSVPYTGPGVPVTEKYFISPRGHTVRFANADNSPIVIVIDKGLLLQGLLDASEKAGVRYYSPASVSSITDEGGSVSITFNRGSGPEKLQARKLIIAEGVNATLAGRLGFSNKRTLFAKALCVMWILEGVDDFEPATLKSYMGRAYRSFTPVITGQAIEDDQRYLVLIGNRDRRPEQVFAAVQSESPIARNFASARIVKKTACGATAYSALKVPHMGNVLVIGDAAAYVEVEMQGAMTCGFRAARAVAEEIEGRDGFAGYAGWWQESFEFNSDDYLQVAQGFALVPTYTDDELDYLFALIEDETLEGTYNQYKSPKLLWRAILGHSDRIRREQPELHEKIQSRNLSLSDSL